MFRKATVAAGVKDFAPYDLKAKGATDLYEDGTLLEDIRALCGHESVKTTEVYIKRHSRKTVKPNDRVPKRTSASQANN
jgi:integrase